MDYREVVRTLRAKAAATEYPAEKEALQEKANDLERRYTSPPVAHTVERVAVTFQRAGHTVVRVFEFPDDWYDSMDDWYDTSDWYSGAE